MDSHHYKDKPTRLVVVPAEREFYELLRRDYPNMSVVTSAPRQSIARLLSMMV